MNVIKKIAFLFFICTYASAALIIGPTGFSSVTDGGSYTYNSGQDSTNMIDGVTNNNTLSGLVWINRNFLLGFSNDLVFTVNMNLAGAADGYDIDTFHLWNDFGSNRNDGVESFSVEFYSDTNGAGSLLSTLTVADIPGAPYDEPRQDYNLTSAANGVKSLIFRVSGFGPIPNGGHIREIAVSGEVSTSVSEPSNVLLLALGAIFVVRKCNRK